MSNVHTTREAWLQAALQLAEKDFVDAGNALPVTIRVGIGNTHSKKSIGECWSAESSDDGFREIWVRPYTRNPIEILGTLVHELCHAALPHEVGHRKPFIVLARKMHLEGKPTATTVGEPFRAVWEPRLEELGPYPGGVLGGKYKERKSPKGPSHIKIECGCGCNWWMTPKQMDSVPGGEFRCVDPDCEDEDGPKPKEKE